MEVTPKLSFISYQQLVSDVTQMSYFIPKFDLVIGVPRSGLLPATILALHWNVPVTTPGLFADKKLLSSGQRLSSPGHWNPSTVQNILVIDDSHYTGKSMAEVKAEVEANAYPGTKFKYAAVYSSNKEHDLDYCGKYVPQPRWFEWNWIHHDAMREACFDMDGVICRPPTPEENDYGPNYEVFLKNTEPRYISSWPIRAIITGRLEKYRPQTEAWLKKHKVKYGELIMRPGRDLPIPLYKAAHFKQMKALFFIEDEPMQAHIIKEEALPGQAILSINEKVIY